MKNICKKCKKELREKATVYVSGNDIIGCENCIEIKNSNEKNLDECPVCGMEFEGHNIPMFYKDGVCVGCFGCIDGVFADELENRMSI